MACAECGREREGCERGWVVVASPPGEPRNVYCPGCLAALIRGALGEAEHGGRSGEGARSD
ncbi:MAG TPA: hypothetical protein VGH79_10785 [Gaiellaceae bacterium]